MFKKVYFVTPTYNAGDHLIDLYESLKEQTNKNWEWYVYDDMSDDEKSLAILNNIASKDKRVKVTARLNKHWALKNLITGLTKDFGTNFPTKSENDAIIAVIDGDDAICNENCVSLILGEYNKNEKLDALWTAHSWDINSMNISRELPGNINPYQYPWVSSHLKTFKLSVLYKINLRNFKDLDGNWFKRGYDQALYLPILHLARERKFLDEICYLYRINSNSIKNRESKEMNQMSTVKLVRSRGYVE